MEISGVTICGKADILYCKDMADTPNHPMWDNIFHVVAVCEVKLKKSVMVCATIQLY